MALSRKDYATALQLTQIVSVDLILEDAERPGYFLLGRRCNAPARNMLFVPGGRMYKAETRDEALQRISFDELGIEMKSSDFQLKGVYRHAYQTDFTEASVPMVYVCLAYTGKLHRDFVDTTVFNIQHSSMHWLTAEEILNFPVVHPYTQAYFRSGHQENQF